MIMLSTATYKKLAKFNSNIKVDYESIDYDNFRSRGIRKFSSAVLARALMDAKDLKHMKICKEARAWLYSPPNISFWCQILNIDPISFSESIKKCLSKYDASMAAFVYFFPYSYLLCKEIWLLKKKMNWKK